MCSDKAVQKMPSAPRLNLGGHAAPPTASGTASDATPGAPVSTVVAPVQADTSNAMNPAAQAAFLKALRHVVANTEDVGERFAEEARRMHYGDTEARNIRGQASMKETVELLEEGIEVMPLPLPAALKETLQ